MAHHDMNTLMSTPEMVWELIAKPFRNFGAGFAKFVVNNAVAQGRMDAARKVAEMTDEELEKLGMTRAYAIQVALRRFE